MSSYVVSLVLSNGSVLDRDVVQAASVEQARRAAEQIFEVAKYAKAVRVRLATEAEIQAELAAATITGIDFSAAA